MAYFLECGIIITAGALLWVSCITWFYGENMSEVGRLKTDPLFLGLTRPPMLFGVSYLFFAVNLLANAVYMIHSSNIIGMVINITVIHAVGFLITRHEPLFIQLYMIRSQKCMKCRNRSYFNSTNSYDVF